MGESHFNPRPREEGDQKLPLNFPLLLISIHALVKRATNLIDKYSIYFDISIHALVKRATKKEVFYDECTKNFNPRPREEGDFMLCLPYISTKISIHALVKRATVSLSIL